MKQSKIVWITGASSGIGWALAQAYNRTGAFTILSARRRNLLEQLQSELPFPEASYVLPLDLAAHDQAPDWAAEAMAVKGHIDVLINNGGMGHLGTVQEMDFAVERQVMEVNLWGAVALTKALLPQFTERNQGQIWTVASILGYFGSPSLAAYAASKFAVVGYFESLQFEMRGTGVHIGLLSPGFVNTSVTLSSLGPDGQPIGKNSVAQEKGMLPEELAKRFVKKAGRKHPPKHLFIGGYERFAVPFKRYLPKLFFGVYGKLTDVTRKKNS